MNPIVYEIFNQVELDHTIKVLAEEFVGIMADTCGDMKVLDPEKADPEVTSRVVVREILEEIKTAMSRDLERRYKHIDEEDLKSKVGKGQ